MLIRYNHDPSDSNSGCPTNKHDKLAGGGVRNDLSDYFLVQSYRDGKSKLAIELLLGKSWVENTVDYIIQLKPEWNLAVNCLKILESEYATDYAYQVYKKTTKIDDSRLAVGIIKDIAHPKAINRIKEFLKDENVANVGLGVLDQLLWTEKIEPSEKTDDLLDFASKNYHELNETVSFIRGYLEKRKT